jgi:hypothetical protein
MENCLIDIPYNKKMEADIIRCFIDDNQIVVFPWFIYDPTRFDVIKSELGDLVDLEPNDMEGLPQKREIFRTKGDILNFGLKDSECIIWFSPINEEELLNVLENVGIGYKCYILKKGIKNTDFDYELEIYEHHEIDNEEYRSLFIRASDESHYQSEVLPKLKKIIERTTI